MSEKRIVTLSQNPTHFGDITNKFNADTFASTQSAKLTQCNLSRSHYKDETLGLYIGVWDSTDMPDVTTPHAYDEFMSIIDGAVDIKNQKTGHVETITAGKSLVIPQGYNGEWYQQENLRTFYVIYQPKETPEKPVTENIVYIDENNSAPWQETSDGHRKKILYQSKNQRFTAGVWQSSALLTDTIEFPYHEFIFINKGSLICTDEMGIAHCFTRGDALFIPQGTRCAWQVNDNVSIYFTQLK